MRPHRDHGWTVTSAPGPADRARAGQYLGALLAGSIAFSISSWPASGQQEHAGCLTPTAVSVSATENLDTHPSYAEAKAAAVRRALAEAVERVAGTEIATSFRSRTTTSIKSIESEAQKNMWSRSKGRVQSWSVEHEDIIDKAGRRDVSVAVNANVCAAMDTDLPAVVAFTFEPSSEASNSESYRTLMSSLFPESPHFAITLESPEGIYYDVLVSARVLEANTIIRDNASDIAILKRFLPAEEIAQVPERTQRVSVRVMARAERLTGASELVEVGTGVRDITPEMDPEPVTRELVRDALVESVKRLYRRLIDGAS